MLKKFLYLMLTGTLFLACQVKDSRTNESDVRDFPENISLSTPTVILKKTVHDFGVIVEGKKIYHQFEFKNTGNVPLIIQSATVTCGCTIPDYPKQPIKPNEIGVIKVIFNSAGKIGKQDKIVTIVSNANPEVEKLHLVGEVVEKSMYLPK